MNFATRFFLVWTNRPAPLAPPAANVSASPGNHRSGNKAESPAPDWGSRQLLLFGGLAREKEHLAIAKKRLRNRCGCEGVFVVLLRFELRLADPESDVLPLHHRTRLP